MTIRIIRSELRLELVMFVYAIFTAQCRVLKVSSKSLENMAKFKYLGVILTQQNYIH
jgi:hypothetical protein